MALSYLRGKCVEEYINNKNSMAMGKLAVKVGSAITAQQWQDFWKKVELNKIQGRNFQEFLDNPNQYGGQKKFGLVTLSRAKQILSRRKIFTVVNFNKIWGEDYADFPIRYSEQDLVTAATQNKCGQDWRLVFYGSQSIIQIRFRFGADRDKQPCFFKADKDEVDWYVQKEEHGWVMRTPDPGYYLINFNAMYKYSDYEYQSNKISLMGESFERTNFQIFTEAIFSIYLLTKERLAENWGHWSSVKASDGDFVRVGWFSATGYSITTSPPQARDEQVSVSVCQKQR